MYLPNGVWDWSMSLSGHVWEAVRICEKYTDKHLNKCYRLSTRANNLCFLYYCSELDVSLALGPAEAPYYQSSIRVMN